MEEENNRLGRRGELNLPTMKRLYILRHAKSSWHDPNLADFDRPLNDRGLNTAPFIGEVIARKHYLPDAILSSPARRAMQTAILVKEAAGANALITYDERIYEASPQALRQVVSETGEEKESVMVVGHNPGMEGFIKYLTGNSEPMPTASVAAIDLDIENWNDLAAECGTLLEIIRPKEEKQAFGDFGA